MANEIYHRSNWGNAVNDIAWGDTYEKFDATNEMFVRSDNYENSNETDKLMSAINPKPSILLTPTAYDNGSLHSVKPVKTFGSELITNGTFDTDTDWTKQTGWSISNGRAISDGSNNYLIQSSIISSSVSKIFKITFTVSDYISGSWNVGVGGYNFYQTSSFSDGNYTVYAKVLNALANTNFYFRGFNLYASIDNVSVKEVIDADFDFTRGSSATRVNEKGLIEDVQILSGELVQNGDFEQIGSELVTNGDFENGSTSWTNASSDIFEVVNGGVGHNTSLHIVVSAINRGAYQSAFVSDKTYYISLDLKVVSGSVYIGKNTKKLNNQNYNNSDWQTITGYLTAIDDKIRIYGDEASEYYVDNVSVKEVGQNWNFVGDTTVVNNGAKFDNISVYSEIRQDNIMTPNSKIRLTITIEDYVGGGIAFPQFGVADGNGNPNFNISANGTYVFESIFYSTHLVVKRTATGTDLVVSNISVIEITDDTNLPRIDYTDGTGALLLEPQRTNLVIYSEDFSQSSWQKQSAGVASAPIVTSNYSISPDGTLNADRVVFNINAGTTSSDFSQIADQITNNIGDVTNSIWIKSNTTSNYNMSFVDPNANYTSIVVTTEWRRFDVTSTTTSTASALRLRLRGSEATSNSADVSVWGAQVEEGSYPTSYITTSGSTVTRNADVCNNAGSSDLINSTEGVLYVEAFVFDDDTKRNQIEISDGSNDNRVIMRFDKVTSKINCFLKIGGTTKGNISLIESNFPNGVTFSDTLKVAYKWKSGDIALWFNGVETNTSTNTFTISSDVLNVLNLQQNNDTNLFCGNVKCVAVFKEALNNDQLERLTGEGYETFNLLAQANNYTII